MNPPKPRSIARRILWAIGLTIAAIPPLLIVAGTFREFDLVLWSKPNGWNCTANLLTGGFSIGWGRFGRDLTPRLLTAPPSPFPQWLPGYRRHSGGVTQERFVDVPLWIPCVIVTAPTVAIWLWSGAKRRRTTAPAAMPQDNSPAPAQDDAPAPVG